MEDGAEALDYLFCREKYEGRDNGNPIVVLLDNKRTRMVGNQYREMLRCIRCGACMNHCPVYHAVGGHAYGATYPGPMGAVLDPAGRIRPSLCPPGCCPNLRQARPALCGSD